MLSKRLRHCAIGLALGWATALPSWADRSLLDQDEEGVEAGDCELELGLERSRARGEPRATESAAQLACGVGWDSELTLAASRQRSAGERIDGLVLELKRTLRPRRERAWGWAVVGTAAAERASPGGRGWRRSEWALELEATLGPRPAWVAEVQFGWARDVQRQANRFTWLAGAEHAPAPEWEVRVELEGDDRDPPRAGATLGWTFWPEVAQAKLSFGRQLGAERTRTWGLSVAFEF